MAAIPFASPGGVELAVDVYRVDGESDRLAVVLLGPGGWGYSSRDTVSGLAISLAQQGFVVFVGDVRLACTDGGPLCGHHYPAPLADVHSLIQFAASHGAEYGARTGPIGVFGLSWGPSWPSWPPSRRRGRRDPAPSSRGRRRRRSDLASNPVAGPIITRYLGWGTLAAPTGGGCVANCARLGRRAADAPRLVGRRSAGAGDAVTVALPSAALGRSDRGTRHRARRGPRPIRPQHRQPLRRVPAPAPLLTPSAATTRSNQGHAATSSTNGDSIVGGRRLEPTTWETAWPTPQLLPGAASSFIAAQ